MAELRALADHRPAPRLPPDPDRALDRHLVGRFLADGDEAAFAALVRRHGPLVLAAARAVLGHHQDAEDVFQAAFLILARKAGSLRKAGSVGSWLFGVARRLALRAKRRAARRRRQESGASVSAVARPGDELTWGEFRAALHEELGRLPDKLRAPLLLCYWEGLTQDEAARRLGCTRDTVKDRLGAAREKLRVRLGRRGVDLSAVLLTIGLAQSAAAGALPTSLVSATAKAAAALSAGQATAAGISANVLALAEGGIQLMALTKSNVITALVLSVGVLVAGAGGLGGPGEGARAADSGQGGGPSPLAAVAGPGEGPGATKEKPTAAANAIDALILRRLKELQAEPDPVFLRRMTLDLLGVLPTELEMRLYLLVRSAAQRQKLIDWMLEEPAVADHWARQWRDLAAAGDSEFRRAASSRARVAELWRLYLGTADQPKAQPKPPTARIGVGTSRTADIPTRLGRLLDELLKRHRSDQRVLESLFLATLARHPGRLEERLALDYLAEQRDRVAAFRVVLGILLESEESARHLSSPAQRGQPAK
jgi:RNA polymerase sigma factor (sigma-70 family)